MKLQNTIHDLLSEMNESDTMKFWHGGNLDEFNETISHKNGRYAYGAGLYLITRYDIAQKYSKGSRKLYEITVKKGNDISDSFLPLSNVNEFIKMYVIGSLRKEVTQRLEKHTKDEQVPADVFNNIILNSKAIKSTKTSLLRSFFVENGIDYELVSNAFGFGETMMVLYNMKKITNSRVILPKEKITIFNFKNNF